MSSANPHSSFSIDFTYAASGDQVLTHNLDLSTYHKRYGPMKLELYEGDAYLKTITKDACTVAVSTAPCKGRIVPTKRVGDNY